MACTFTIPFEGTSETMFVNIRNKILDAGGVFNGAAASGNFAIQLVGAAIEGAYSIDGNAITITIERKPFFVSCDAIKGYVTQNLTSLQ